MAAGTSGIVPITIDDTGALLPGTEDLLTNGDTQLSSIACPTAASCVAVGYNAHTGEGGDVVAVALSPQGSITSTSQGEPNGTGNLGGVACVNAQMCVAVGSSSCNLVRCGPAGFGQSGGAGVVVPVTITAPGQFGTGPVVRVRGTWFLTAVTCPTASLCVATAQVGERPTSGSVVVPIAVSGTGFPSPQPVVAAPGSLNLVAIACADASTCVASGEPVTTGETGVVVPLSIDGSGSVTTGAAMATAGTIGLALACPDATDCVLTGRLYAQDAQVVPVSLDGSGDLTVGTVVTSPDRILASGPIGCPLVSLCVTAGGDAVAPITVSPGVLALGPTLHRQAADRFTGVECPTATTCLAYGAASAGGIVVPVAVDARGELRLRAGDTVSTTATVTGLACVSPAACVAVLGDGSVAPIAVTGPGAVSVGPTQPVADVTVLNAVACTTAGDCIAIAGDDVVPLTVAPGSVSAASPVPAPAAVANLVAVACASSSICVAAGESLDPTLPVNIAAVVPIQIGASGVTVGAPQAVPGSAFESTFTTLACPTASQCVGAGPVITGGSVGFGTISIAPSDALTVETPQASGVEWGGRSPGVRLQLADIVRRHQLGHHRPGRGPGPHDSLHRPVHHQLGRDDLPARAGRDLRRHRRWFTIAVARSQRHVAEGCRLRRQRGRNSHVVRNTGDGHRRELPVDHHGVERGGARRHPVLHLVCDRPVITSSCPATFAGGL